MDSIRKNGSRESLIALVSIAKGLLMFVHSWLNFDQWFPSLVKTKIVEQIQKK